jgi:hypothetical protein
VLIPGYDKAKERKKGMRGDGGLKEKKEKLIKTKFISFGFVVVEEFLIKKSAVGVRWKIKSLLFLLYSACSSNLKSAHLFSVSVYVFLTALAFWF